MLYSIPTYALCAEVSLTLCSTKGEGGVFMPSEPLSYVRGGNISSLNSNNYSKYTAYYGHSVRVSVVGFFVYIIFQNHYPFYSLISKQK